MWIERSRTFLEQPSIVKFEAGWTEELRERQIQNAMLVTHSCPNRIAAWRICRGSPASLNWTFLEEKIAGCQGANAPVGVAAL